ncbi:hypothetical protein KTD31_00765 [Burkholderia multivorans]|uniref:hypothetical protein n=1 Tax=Burkholderia multivorans TaxID=87883 RepID=UPI001C24580A|nr:hypothetical protein [Burkholderia multivorans]MBU9199932.1 hypothetical protein [Burkholderia multivorans]MDN8078949.1 hypothetical protein [Burkholderia multivorans]
MRDIVISQLERLLKAGDIRKSLEVMRGWLDAAEPGEPEQLLTEASDEIRPRLALLMRDLLSRFPSTIVGAPMLVYSAPDFEDANWAQRLKLPFPGQDDNQPCADLHFLGWLHADTPLPISLPFHPERYALEVEWQKPTGVVALFRSHPALFDLDTVELPNFWWANLFRPVSANIHLSARMLLPYPDALEAVRLMQAFLRKEQLPGKGLFLTDAAWGMALDEATLFQESCRHLFRDTSR